MGRISRGGAAPLRNGACVRPPIGAQNAAVTFRWVTERNPARAKADEHLPGEYPLSQKMYGHGLISCPSMRDRDLITPLSVCLTTSNGIRPIC
ncbi:hypothetical protein J6590_024592 [Homalodisca vitripennis]|nr:hypothetical protein J6590_024592 [Homalodisca vitripennis]